MKDTQRAGSLWEVFIVPGSHFDLGWCASPAECLAYGDEIIRTAIDSIVGEHPEFRFTVEYALFLQHFLSSHPKYRGKVKKLLQEGKIEVCASMTGGMEQALDGEVLIRQVVEAKRWAMEELGYEPIVAQHSDLPGHTIQMPQILAKAGVRYFTYSRFHPPVPLHYWAAPDGSRVLAAHHMHGYGWGFVVRRSDAPALRQQLSELEGVWPVRQVLMVDQSDLIMPDVEIATKARRLERQGIPARFRLAVLRDFFAAIEPSSLPTYKGEAPYAFYALPAAFAEIYREARRAEHALASAEKLSAVRRLLGLGEYPPHNLQRGWCLLFLPHDHNTGGRHGSLNDEARLQAARTARLEAEAAIQEAVVQLVTHINYRGSGAPLLIVNPLSWERDEIVETEMEFDGSQVQGLMAVDDEGHEVPCQVLEREAAADRERLDYRGHERSWLRFAMRVSNLPSLGYRTIYLKPSREPLARVVRRPLDGGSLEMESDFYRLQLDPDGTIRSLLWKPRNVELIASEDYPFNQLVALHDPRWDLEDALDEQQGQEGWNFTGKEWRAYLKPSLMEEGPLWQRVVSQGHVMDAPVEQQVTVYKHVNRIDLTTTVDWRDAPNTQLQLVYPFNVPGGRITYETPFAYVVLGRDELPGTYRGRGERWVQKWIDISNGSYGIALGVDHCAHRLWGQTIRPILLRTAYSCGTPFVWSRNEGRHSFRYRLVAHEGDWRDVHAHRIGWEHNVPVQIGRMATCRPIAPVAGRDTLPDSFSFCCVEEGNIVISSMRAVAESTCLVRMFEAEGRDTEAHLSFPFPIARAAVVDLLDREVDSPKLEGSGKELSCSVKANEIVCLRIEFGR